MMKNVLTFVIGMITLSGCGDGLTKRLMQESDKKCGSGSKTLCTVAIKDVTDFKWDKMYLFEDWTFSDSISNKLGFEYMGNDVADDNTRMLFTYDKKIVYERDFTSLDYHNSTIIFLTDNNDILYTKKNYLTPETAVFEVRKSKTENGCENCFLYAFTLKRSNINQSVNY